MLNSASKGKDLVEKQLILLGGTPDQQREFLEQQLNPPNLRPRYANNDRRRQPRTAPISNRYALGYTYHDVLDADQEDVLARLNVYMLAHPSASFAALLKPLFTAKTVKDTLLTILLDWSDPLKWAKQLRQWIRLLRFVILTLDEETKIEMEEVMTAWKERRVSPDAASSQIGGGNKDSAEQKSFVPLGPGEWDEGLGMPLSVVCIQAEKIQNLERDHNWGEDQFDFLMQWLRCVLLKHGASLVYTATFDPNNVRTLIHTSLSIHSLLKREVARHNIVDRDKVLVPPNWDSWGKIRILKEGFDTEAVSNSWSVEIQALPEEKFDLSANTPPSAQPEQQDKSTQNGDTKSAVSIYETTLRHPTTSLHQYQPRSTEEPTTVPTVQEFLQSAYDVLEKLKAEDEKAERKARKGAPAPTGSEVSGSVDSSTEEGTSGISNPRMAEHIGPYQINVNGIDFDAEEATRRLRERESDRQNAASTNTLPSSAGITSTPTRRIGSDQGGAAEGSQTPTGGKQSNEAMSQFFANLIHRDKKERKGPGSAAASPTRAASPLVRASNSRDLSGERVREK